MATVQTIGTATPMDTVPTETRLEELVTTFGTAYVIDKLISVLNTKLDVLLSSTIGLASDDLTKARFYSTVQRQLIYVSRTAARQENL